MKPHAFEIHAIYLKHELLVAYYAPMHRTISCVCIFGSVLRESGPLTPST